MVSVLEIKDLHVSVEGKTILKGVDLVVKQGEIASIMGPNGSGKTTLAYTVMGHPKYKIDQGDILIDGVSIVATPPDQRAKMGLFLAFQYPVEVSGVTLANFLRRAYLNLKGKRARPDGEGKEQDKKQELLSIKEFQKLLKDKLELLQMDTSFARRYLNEGFSGGEKKRAEVLQLAVLQPKIAVLDETDSGLDIDLVRLIGENISRLREADNMGIMLITHYARILRYTHPDVVHILYDGKVALSGDYSLAEELEQKGYDILREKLGEAYKS